MSLPNKQEVKMANLEEYLINLGEESTYKKLKEKKLTEIPKLYKIFMEGGAGSIMESTNLTLQEIGIIYKLFHLMSKESGNQGLSEENKESLEITQTPKDEGVNLGESLVNEERFEEEGVVNEYIENIVGSAYPRNTELGETGVDDIVNGINDTSNTPNTLNTSNTQIPQNEVNGEYEYISKDSTKLRGSDNDLVDNCNIINELCEVWTKKEKIRLILMIKQICDNNLSEKLFQNILNGLVNSLTQETQDLNVQNPPNTPNTSNTPNTPNTPNIPEHSELPKIPMAIPPSVTPMTHKSYNPSSRAPASLTYLPTDSTPPSYPLPPRTKRVIPDLPFKRGDQREESTSPSPSKRLQELQSKQQVNRCLYPRVKDIPSNGYDLSLPREQRLQNYFKVLQEKHINKGRAYTNGYPLEFRLDIVGLMEEQPEKYRLKISKCFGITHNTLVKWWNNKYRLRQILSEKYKGKGLPEYNNYPGNQEGDAGGDHGSQAETGFSSYSYRPHNTPAFKMQVLDYVERENASNAEAASLFNVNKNSINQWRKSRKVIEKQFRRGGNNSDASTIKME